eukprot:scaffold12.g8153.t1
MSCLSEAADDRFSKELLIESIEHSTADDGGGATKAAAWRPPSRALLLAVAASSLVAICVLGARATLALGRPPGTEAAPVSGDEPPYCRKSSSVVALPASGGEGSMQLLVWAGIGKHKRIFEDLYSFDLGGKGGWRVLRDRARGHEFPVPRWKAGNAQARGVRPRQAPRLLQLSSRPAQPAAGGLVVVGGDAYLPGTRNHRYENDVWRLSVPAMRWARAQVADGAPEPAPRRGHSTMLHLGADGLERIVIFGGRTQDKLVFGGREDLYYFGDAFVLDIQAGRWQMVSPYGPARDHQAVAVHGGKMYAFGGRAGTDYCHSSSLNDVVALDLETWAWEEVETKGAPPLPRFEHAYVQYSPRGSNGGRWTDWEGGSRLVVFGGQSESVCQLNDVWELDLSALEWRALSPPRFCTKKCRKAHRARRAARRAC